MLPRDSLSPPVAAQELLGPVLDLRSKAPVEKELRAIFSAACPSFLADRNENPRSPVCSKSSLEVPVFIVKQGGRQRMALGGLQ